MEKGSKTMRRHISITTVALLTVALLLSCGGGEETPEAELIEDSTDITAEDSLMLHGHRADDESPEQPDHGSHSAAFMILEETREVADEANDRIREMNAALEDIR